MTAHGGSRAVREHHAHAPTRVRVAVITVSDSKTRETDEGGARAASGLEAAGHAVTSRALVRDDVDAIREALGSALAQGDVDAVVLTGGTGIAPRDVTPEAVQPFIEQSLPGFGELFRALSFKEVGAAALASRASAGIASHRAADGERARKPVFLLPGSPHAVALAVDALVAPELGHLVALANRG